MLRRDCYLDMSMEGTDNTMPDRRNKNTAMCSCVHMCENFMTLVAALLQELAAAGKILVFAFMKIHSSTEM